MALKSGSAGRETAVRQTTAIALSSPEAGEPALRNTAGGRFRSVEIPFDKIIAGLENVDELIREVGIRFYSKYGKRIGFRIESVTC